MIAGILIYGFGLARLLPPPPRFIAFRLLILFVLLVNALWWTIADRRFARFAPSLGISRGLRVIALVFAFGLNLPIVHMLVRGRMPDFLNTAPTWYAAAVTFWHLSLVLLMPAVASIRLAARAVALLVGRLAPRRDARDGEDRDEDPEANPGRRALLHAAVASVPMVLLGAATGAARAQERRLQVNRHTLKAPWLPDRLRGLTLTHICDFHVGRLYRPYRLRQLVDTVNALNSDLILVTGDLVDVSNDMLPPAINALRQMEHRHGLYNCIGNHDEIDNRRDFIAFARQSVPMLINQRRTLEIDGERLTIAGLDFDRGDAPSGRRAGYRRSVEATLNGHDELREGPVIALAHHPHSFDRLAERGVPLTLAGHTHGGQLMLTPPGSTVEVGAGSVLFRYIRGFYRRGGGTLFVNSGVGNWFPLRIHAPAEVVQIRLV